MEGAPDRGVAHAAGAAAEGGAPAAAAPLQFHAAGGSMEGRWVVETLPIDLPALSPVGS